VRNRIGNAVLGGWALNSILTLQSGPPLAWGNMIYYGGPLDFTPHQPCEPNLERGLSNASKIAGNHPKAYRNYKELLADKDIQAVLITTPEHWHAQMVLDALAAGKHVYVEKPLCANPEEGIQLLEAERKSKSIIQVGTQRRSYDLFLEGRDLVKSGKQGARRQAGRAARLATMAGLHRPAYLRSQSIQILAVLIPITRAA
jgi:predicted dehydrogenase